MVYNVLHSFFPCSFANDTAPPTITSPASDVDVTVVAGNDAVFTCTAQGSPAPDIVWYRGAMQLTGNEPRVAIVPMVSMNSDGFSVVVSMLTISPSDPSDSGMYSCMAVNTVGGSPRMAQRNFDLTVNCK